MFYIIQLLHMEILWSIVSLLILDETPSTPLKTTKTGAYTGAEISAIYQFRSVLNQTMVGDYDRSDMFLIRWLRVNDLNVHRAHTMLQKALEWRKQNKMDSILSEVIDLKAIREPCLNAGVDYDGRPVSYISSGGIDSRRWAVAGQSNKLKRLMIQCLENMIVRIRQASSDSNTLIQGIAIIDFAGYNIRQHGCIQCMQVYHDFAQDVAKYYPGLIKLIVLINVPGPGKVAIDLILSIAPKSLLVVPVEVYSSRKEWVPILLKMIPANQLPVKYGGTLNPALT